MRGNIMAEQVSLLARLAGFDFDAARCALLAPQLGWLARESAHVNGLDLAGEEPAIVFRPADYLWQREAPDSG